MEIHPLGLMPLATFSLTMLFCVREWLRLRAELKDEGNTA